MIPQDTRSPFRNQRWIECEGENLAFGDCVEITDGNRPEQGSALTPGGGRTVFQVETPTRNSVANTVIIGHMAGEKGYGTNDFPTYAKCDQNVIVGDRVGPVMGSRILSPDASGYLVMGDIQDGMARVRRLDSFNGVVTFQLLEDRSREIDQAGNYFGRADARVTDILGDVPVAVNDIIEVIFAERLWLGAVEFCYGIADYYNDNGDKWVVKECQELANQITGIITQDRDPQEPNENVPMSISDYRGSSNAVFPPASWLLNSPLGMIVCYPGLRWPRALNEATFTALLDVDYDNISSNAGMKYYVVESDQMTTRIIHTHPKFCAGQTFAAGNPGAMDFHPFSQQPNLPVLVNDVHGWASMGGVGQSGWDESGKRWVIVQPQLEMLEFLMPPAEGGCPVFYKQSIAVGRCTQPEIALEFEEFDAVLSVEASLDGCNIDLDLNYTNFCAVASPNAPRAANTETIEFETTNALSDVELVFTEDSAESGSSGENDCNPDFRLNYKSTPVIKCGDESALQNASIIPITQEAVVVEIDMSGCPTWTTSVVYVLGSCGNDAEHEADCEPCPEDSGSGQ